MDGIRLNDSESLEAFGVDKQKIIEEITRAYAHQIYVDGFFNGDPHPGNGPFSLSSLDFMKIMLSFSKNVLHYKLVSWVLWYRKFSCEQGTSKSSNFAWFWAYKKAV